MISSGGPGRPHLSHGRRFKIDCLRRTIGGYDWVSRWVRGSEDVTALMVSCESCEQVHCV